MVTKITEESREELESLLETIEAEGWDVLNYEVDAHPGALEVKKAEFVKRADGDLRMNTSDGGMG